MSTASFFKPPAVLAAPLAALLAAGVLGGCTSLPTAGPSTRQIVHEGSTVVPIALVAVSPGTIETLRKRRDDSLAGQFGSDEAMPVPQTVGIGDGVTVSLWEAGSATLFATAGTGGRGVTIPEQFVAQDGEIVIPFAGHIRVLGRSATEVQASIEKALTGKTQAPQALVSVRPVANAVTLLGEAVGGVRLPLTARGERVLDALAAAGGARAPVYETRVQLTRGARQVELPLARVLHDPGENVRLQPGDQLVVTRSPESFSVFGAAGRNTQINFEQEHVNLIEAVAKSGGLLDQRADPEGVFLFRYEPAELARSLDPKSAGDGTAPVPVVYQLDLTRAGAYFLGQSFELRDRDVLYVASAPANELQKFLVLLGLISQPIINGAIVNQAVK